MLQEFDLPRGVTIIGRSAECHLTIDDPLVSRKHARIAVDDESARVEDLSSRNGLRVNSILIREATRLRNGDRIRIGTQELVFSELEPFGRIQARTTGHLRVCARCRQPYPRELAACPACGATEQTDEDTLTATTSALNRWGIQLFVEAIERALRLGRGADALRLARRAIAQVAELSAAGGAIAPEPLFALASLAAETASLCDDPDLAAWAIEVHGSHGRVPAHALLDRIDRFAPRHQKRIADAARQALEQLKPGLGGSDEGAALRRLRDFAARPSGAPSFAEAQDGTPPPDSGAVHALAADDPR